MTTEALARELARHDPAHSPEPWAVAAYRLAVARAETAATAAEIDEALALLGRAGEILTETRAPLEHARILTATAQCQRTLGRPDRAVPVFERAAELLEPRAPASEYAASLVNVGLARTEAGRPSAALDPLDRAIALLADAGDDAETRRVLGAALLNRAQTRQAVGSASELHAAIGDYESAVALGDDGSPQRGMAWHGLGTTILELHHQGAADATPDRAIDAFQASLRVLTSAAFPFQHAVARHSLGIAYERRGGPLDSARAANSVEAAMTVFDPRLHPAQWRTAAETLARIDERAADAGSRIERFVSLLADTDPHERTVLLRERLTRLGELPAVRSTPEIEAIVAALVDRGPDDYDAVMRSMIPVLMELPDSVLDSACRALALAHRSSGQAEVLDRRLDRIIHDLLHGPQRVRVRDLLESHGWVRP